MSSSSLSRTPLYASRSVRGLHGSTELMPNRFTTAFTRMKETCPQAIQAYAQCVTTQQEEAEGLVQHACREEFAAVKACFRAARRES